MLKPSMAQLASRRVAGISAEVGELELRVGGIWEESGEVVCFWKRAPYFGLLHRSGRNRLRLLRSTKVAANDTMLHVHVRSHSGEQ